MSDTQTVEDSASSTTTAASAEVYTIPVTKAKQSIEIAIDDVPDDVYKEALLLGLKEIVNRGMSKITVAKLSGKDLESAQAAAMEAAAKNVEAIKTSKIRFAGKKADSKVSGAEQTEAMRLAKNLVKDAMKSAGLKISHTPASEITAAAKEVLASDPTIYATARANLESRAKTPIKIDIKKLVKADPKLVAKAEAAKDAKKKDKPISAKQAGMVAPRQKPKPAGATAH